MTGGVLVVGDANVDLVVQGDVIPRFGQAEQLLDVADLVLGGSASIVAIGLARLGVDTSLAAVVGDDEFGGVMRAALAVDGVRLDALHTHPTLPTGISVILSTSEDRSILTLPGTVPLLTAAEVRDAVGLLAPGHVHFASYFLQPSLAAELPELLAWLRARGVATSLDTNWDPAERWAGVMELLPLIDYLFPNVEELRAIAATLDEVHDADEDAARSLAALGPTVVVKAGRAGGWSMDARGTVVRAPGLEVEVVDTTGAGDSFDAGYLAAIAHGVDSERDRLRWATVAGSLSTLGRGGTRAQPTLTELRSRLSK